MTEQDETQTPATPDALAQEFHEEVNTLLYPKDGTGKLLQSRANMGTLRQLQQKYVEQGAKIEDLDVSPKAGIPKGHTIRDWYPPGR